MISERTWKNLTKPSYSIPIHTEHASHVVMSVMKLLGSASNHKDDGLDDPLARFTLVLAAIVHDAVRDAGCDGHNG